jgi:hypothetical protein
MRQGSPDPPERPADEADSAEPKRCGPPERYGPLLVRRLRKADGRALIVYRRDTEAPGGDGYDDG